MTNSSDYSPVFERFISPLKPFQDTADHQYLCHKVPDCEWINLGLERVIGDHRSGCAFVQERVLRDLLNVSKSHYFESCKSIRRFRHLTSLSTQFVNHHAQLALKANDLFGAHPEADKCLEHFHIYAGDGHFHSASSHDKQDDKGVKNAIGHLYALNLRNQFLSHLSLGSDGTKKKPHDMGELKKLDVKELRQGAEKGQKVLYIWDRAGIDFPQWYKWKNNNGIYFLSRVKKNMKLEHPLAQNYDKENPINAGVVADELVSNSSGTMIRRIGFRVPETGELIEFLTNLGHVVPPGVVAQLYFMRWRIEKSFDELKNKLYETKAWAMSTNAKRMQAAFIITAYNLAQLLHAGMEEQNDHAEPQDQASYKKRHERLEALSKEVNNRAGQLPLLRQIYRKVSQLSVKYYRWLENPSLRSSLLAARTGPTTSHSRSILTTTFGHR
jgi:hypothetical protein